MYTVDDVATFKDVDKLHLHLRRGLATVNVERRVDLWTTFAYDGWLPDGFSALPPT